MPRMLHGDFGVSLPTKMRGITFKNGFKNGDIFISLRKNIDFTREKQILMILARKCGFHPQQLQISATTTGTAAAATGKTKSCQSCRRSGRGFGFSMTHKWGCRQSYPAMYFCRRVSTVNVSKIGHEYVNFLLGHQVDPAETHSLVGRFFCGVQPRS